MIENEKSGVGIGFGSGEVRVHGEGAEVGGDGGVGRRREEEALEGGGFVLMFERVRKTEGVESEDD